MSNVNEDLKPNSKPANPMGADLPPKTYVGKIVSITGSKLTIANKEGKQRSHTLADDLKLTREGKGCKVGDFQAGHDVRVTIHQYDKNVAVSIEGLTKKTVQPEENKPI